MTEEQRELLKLILSDTYYQHNSTDDSFHLIEDLIYDIISQTKRSVE